MDLPGSHATFRPTVVDRRGLPRAVRFSIKVVSSNRGTDDFTRDH
jgi:hypothetical protein